MRTVSRCAWALGGMVAVLVGLGSGAQAQQMGAGAAGIGVDNQFNGNTFDFDRHVAQLSLTQAFY